MIPLVNPNSFSVEIIPEENKLSELVLVVILTVSYKLDSIDASEESILSFVIIVDSGLISVLKDNWVFFVFIDFPDIIELSNDSLEKEFCS